MLGRPSATDPKTQTAPRQERILRGWSSSNFFCTEKGGNTKPKDQQSKFPSNRFQTDFYMFLSIPTLAGWIQPWPFSLPVSLWLHRGGFGFELPHRPPVCPPPDSLGVLGRLPAPPAAAGDPGGGGRRRLVGRIRVTFYDPCGADHADTSFQPDLVDGFRAPPGGRFYGSVLIHFFFFFFFFFKRE